MKLLKNLHNHSTNRYALLSENSKLFYTIGEVAEMIGESTSLLRFWEKEFPQLKPQKNENGIRKYTISDIQLIQHIHFLLKEKGMTIDGARILLKDEKKLSNTSELVDKLKHIRSFLVEIKDTLNKK